jgi:hypothetical protein
LEMTEVSESRLRWRDRIARKQRNPDLSRIYANPQNFKDLLAIADDLEWMARKLPHYTPLAAWLEARLWIWD